MALRKIITQENDILRKVSKPVTRFDESLWDLLDDMKETLIKSTGVGLAAPQVAVLKRVFLLMVNESYIEVINPKITKTSGVQTGPEGCLSIPGKQSNVTRPNKVTVDFYDRYHACIDDRYIKIGYQEQFKENGISKTVYSKFLSKQTWEQDFDKKFFINLGFLLSLPYSMLNTLLSYNGYSLNASTRKFDEIMDRAFKIGFGRELAIDLIDFYNFEMLDEYGTKIVNGKEKENFGKVPSLNSIKENEEIPSA